MATGILYIDEQLADLPDAESVKITRSFLDLQNPESRNGDVSLPIKLPKTATNCRILGNIQIENIQDKFVRQEEHRVRYEANGRKLLNGIIRILQITETDFECTMASANVSWAKELNGLTLRDLKNDDNLTPWSTPFFGLSGSSTPYSINWYNENTTFATSPIAFPLISYGTFFTGEQNAFVNGIWDDSIGLDDVPPSVYDLSIVRQIFKNLGWKIDSPVFANNEAQNLVMPFTASDQYEYNYGQVIEAHASGSSTVFYGKASPQNFDFMFSDTYVVPAAYSPTDYGKRMGVGHMRFPQFIYNPHFNFKNFSADTLFGTSYSWFLPAQYYQTPVSTFYNFDIDIRNWQLMVSGTTHYTDAPTDAEIMAEIVAQMNTVGGSSPTATATEADIIFNVEAAHQIDRGQISREFVDNGLSSDYLRAGFVIFIDDPTDPTRKDNIFREVCDYMYNIYNGSPETIENVGILAAYFPTHTGSTNYWQPYDQDANIAVIDDLTKSFQTTTSISFTDSVQVGFYYDPTHLPDPENVVASMNVNSVNKTYVYQFTGNTKFEFREFALPSSQRIKVMVVAPMYNIPISDPTPPTLYDEIYSMFTCTYVDFDFNVLNDDGVSANPNDDTDLNIAKNLPDVGQLEYVKTFIARNYLFIQTDTENKTIRLESYDDYFLPNDFAIDITSDIDNNYGQPATKPVNLPKTIYFKYENDTSDVLLYQDPDFANLQIVSDNIYSDNEKTINQLFSSTKTRDFLVNSSYNIVSLLPVTLPSIANEENYSNLDLTSVQWTFAYSPRILKLDGFATFDDLVGNPETPIYVNMGGFPFKILKSRFEDTRPGRLNLRFDTNNGLYSTFYERNFNELSQSFILVLNSKISVDKFNRMQTNVPVLVNGQSYIINLISNFDTLNPGVTKLELIKRFTN